MKTDNGKKRKEMPKWAYYSYYFRTIHEQEEYQVNQYRGIVTN
jgi:hypothetical protein